MSYITTGAPGEETVFASPETIASRRRLAQALMQDGTSAAPVQHWTQALARVTQALSGAANDAWANSQANAAKKAATGRAKGDDESGAMALYQMLAGPDQAPEVVGRGSAGGPPRAVSAAPSGPQTIGGMSRDQFRMALSNPATRQLALKMALEERAAAKQAADPERQLELEYRRAQIDALKQKAAGGGEGGAEYGLNPVFGVDANGNPVVMQLSKAGGVKPVPMPDGIQVSKAPIKLDAGNEFILLDPITRQPVGRVSKDLAEAERLKEIGKATGTAQANLPTVEANAKQMLDMLDATEADPNLDIVTGAYGGRVPENLQTPAMAATQSRINQLKGQTFLQAYERLKGGGQITEIEGKKAEAAISRLNTQTMSAEEYRIALREAKQAVKELLEVARVKARAMDAMGTAYDPRAFGSAIGSGSALPAQPAQPSGGFSIRRLP